LRVVSVRLLVPAPHADIVDGVTIEYNPHTGCSEATAGDRWSRCYPVIGARW
jgi:hypothetical protein